MIHLPATGREALFHRPGLIPVPSPRPRSNIGHFHGRPGLPGDLMPLPWPGQAGLVDHAGLAAHDHLERPV